MKKPSQLIFPAVVVVAVILILVGWRAWGGKHGQTSPWPALDGGVYAQAVTRDGINYLVPPDQVYASGLTADDRPALTAPKMVDVTAADAMLADELEGLAVTVGDEQRFYPFQILNWHEVVNDTVNGKPLVITYSALTGSAVVYDDSRHFSDAGKVYNNAMLMHADNDDTLWNQTSGEAIVGAAVGDHLTIYPSTVMSWATWKKAHPSGLALSTDTGYERDYGRHPYASYETSPAIYFPLNHTDARKLEPKELVYRVDPSNSADQPVVFLGKYLPTQADPNATLGTGDAARQIVAFYDADQKVVRVFDRQVHDRLLTFENKNGRLTDKETGSRWSAAGVATSGSLRGTTLTEIPVTRHYAFAEFAMFPQTVVSGEDLIPTTTAPSTDNSEPLLIN